VDVPDSLRLALSDRYALDRELGQGGMATVYLAEDLRHHRKVAIKVLKPDLAAALGPERFLREIELSAQLTHPHILPMLDSGGTAAPGHKDPGKFLYYVMPFVAGESLRDRLDRERQLPLDDALQIAREVADGLAYAHSHGVIHRDIKPENILLESGHAVIADFGIAKAIAAAGSERLTETGLAVGTPPYMSPEQASGGSDLDGRSDLYSLGCVLYEMLAGQPPFTGPTAESVVRQHLTVDAPSITGIRPAVPAHVAAALQRALAKTQADRFATTSRFAEALRGTTTLSVPAARTAMERRGRRVAAAAAALAILSVAGWLGARRLRPPSSASSPAHRPYTIVAELDGNAPAEVRAAARNLIVSALDESGVLASLPDDQVRLGLTLAGKPETMRLDVVAARELAVRGSVRTVVTGTIDQVGRTYHAAVRVLDADSGIVVASRSDVARGEDDLIPTLDRVVRTVRGDLGERRAAIAANRPLEQAATASFAAYQRYRRARELTVDGDNVAAVAAYKSALALDPQFAAAWRALSAAYSNMGFPDSGLAAVNSALGWPDRLTDQQRLVAEGFRAGYLGDDSANAAVQEQAHRLYGGSPANLSQVLDRLGRVSEAAGLFEDWERSAPFGLRPLELSDLTAYLLALGRFDEARRRAASLSGDIGMLARLRVAVWTADWPAAESLATGLLDRTRIPRWRTDALWTRASVAAAQGRVREAQGILGTCPCRLQQLGLRLISGSPVTGFQQGATPADTATAGRLLAAMEAAAAGDTSAARHILTRVRIVRSARRPRLEDQATLVEAWLAAAAGRPGETVRLLRPLAQRGTPAGRGLTQAVGWSLAVAYERQGQLDSAAAQLERLAAWQGASVSDGTQRGLAHAFAHQRLVMLYLRLGRLDAARRHWQVFLETFTTPDPEVRHLVDEARAALANAERRH
jgi:serine/threonine protein kinase/tetratricopeptide (TPR) repeat protein